MRVAALASLFLIRVSVSHSKSVVEINRKRHGQNPVKKLRKLEKPSCRLCNAQIELEFLLDFQQ